MIAQFSFSILLALTPSPQEQGWPPELDAALERAGSAQALWRDSLSQVPEDLRADLGHLIAVMPTADLISLSPARILAEVELAVKVRAEVPWGAALPDALFREHVLPYAHVSEARDPWRQELTDLCLPMVADCKTPAEAAQRLNERLFNKLGVRYSTKRKRPDQSPAESMEQGLASCTGSRSSWLMPAGQSVSPLAWRVQQAGLRNQAITPGSRSGIRAGILPGPVNPTPAV